MIVELHSQRIVKTETTYYNWLVWMRKKQPSVVPPKPFERAAVEEKLPSKGYIRDIFVLFTIPLVVSVVFSLIAH